MATVFMLVGLTGAGKTTYARRVLEPAGAVRLSVDEVVFAGHGRYGVDYPADVYFELYDEALAQVRAALEREIADGHDVVLDLGIWRRADRDDWKRRIEAAGCDGGCSPSRCRGWSCCAGSPRVIGRSTPTR